MRPKKYKAYRLLTIGLDQKDIEFLDDHRGKIPRGDYLREAMYTMKGENSETLKTNAEKIKLLSNEVHELKKQLMFEQTKLHKLKPRQEAPLSENKELQRLKWWNEKQIKQKIDEMGVGRVVWETLFAKSLDYDPNLWTKAKECEDWTKKKYLNNGEATHNQDKIYTTIPERGQQS